MESASQVRRCCSLRRAVAAVVAALLGTAADAAPLDPNAYGSLGALNVASGLITINTDTLAIGGAVNFIGVTQPQGAGQPDVAVFAFSNVNIGAGVTIGVAGARPLALLSQGTMQIATNFTLSGGNATT